MEIKKGLTRRIFIGRSAALTGGAVVLANLKSWPAWADENFEGTVSRMGRIVIDPEAKRTWVSWLRVDVTTDEIQTEQGPTNASRSVDHILVKSKGRGPYTRPVDVSAGQPHAKLDPRIAARGGRACVVWCAMDHDTRQWHVYLTHTSDGRNWSAPIAVAGGERPALHPSVALDPDSGRAWIAYEDWADNSIRLISFDGQAASEPVKISEAGKNFRPRVIVTRKSGRNQAAVAVAWDAYRDGQYDIFLRLVTPGGEPGPELRATQSPQWDCGADLAEDLDGNIWVVWVRASNELAETNALREVRARFWDGIIWRWPMSPDEFLSDENGRVSGYAVAWHPMILVDDLNRVHIFWRDGMNPMPPILGHLQRRTYEGNRWTKQNKIKVNHGKDALHMIWDFSIAMDDQYRLEGVWDSQYVKRLGFANQVSHTRHEAVPTRDRTRFTVQGHDAPERIPAGWPRQRKPESRVMEYEGKTLTMLYGDTHTHSWTSDGADPADYYYHFARDFAGLDYFALSDHDFTVSYTPGLEALISFLPEQFTEKDFICFQAFEFSSQHKGHRVVVFERGYKPTFSMVVPPKNISNKTGQLYRFLHRFGGDSNSRVLVTSHNMFSIGNDFAEYDEGLEPLYDVTSLHMVAEKSFEEIATVQQATGNLLGFQLFKLIGNINKLNPSKSIAEKWFMSWRQALADGLPLGAYGGSDTHAANAVGYVASGLWVEGKSPKAIFDAMFARRSLGLDSQLRSGDMWNTSPLVRNRVRTPDMLRADVRFFLSGHFMGSRVKLDSAPVVRVVAANLDPHDPVRAVVFIRDGVEVHTEFGAEGGRSEFEWTDTGFSPGRHYYYVRVEFQSGNTAFPSPVFVNY